MKYVGHVILFCTAFSCRSVREYVIVFAAVIGCVIVELARTEGRK